MKRSEFLELVRAAKTERGDSYGSQALDGIALHSERRMVSRDGAIAFIRWQALCFDGTWNTQELEQCAFYFRRVELIDQQELGCITEAQRFCRERYSYDTKEA